ncbi:MAG: NUDIX domain-containing protein [Phycisphaerae bacterium]|jgi:dATP pyrophosphohydrolase
MPQIVSDIVDVYVFRRRSGTVEFLLLRRAAGVALGGTWQSVHGHVEPGEPAWRAGLRELREETGLGPLGFWQLDFVNTFYVASRDAILMCPCFAAEAPPDAQVKLSTEHTEFAWLATADALRRFMWPGQRRAVEETVCEIAAHGPAERHLRIDAADRP